MCINQHFTAKILIHATQPPVGSVESSVSQTLINNGNEIKHDTWTENFYFPISESTDHVVVH